jgi:alpha,alpha-trehalase
MNPAPVIGRRAFLTGSAKAAAGLCLAGAAGISGRAGEAPGSVTAPDEEHWRDLDKAVRRWWDDDTVNANEAALRSPENAALLFLPFPYLRISKTYTAQFPVDTAFTNYALFDHQRLDLVRDQLLNYLFLIERYGFVPNANLQSLLTRSQTPFFVPPTLWRYYSVTKDRDFLELAYPLLKREYEGYWKAPHHQTPIGLATNRDLNTSGKGLSPELASEAEVLDFVPVFGGDVRRCVPVATNVGLVSNARVLALLAKELGREKESQVYTREAELRTELISKYCWNEARGLFLEYDYVAQRQLPYASEFAYWTLWGGVATRQQAARLLGNLHLLEQPYGLSVTDRDYPDPHSEAAYEIKGSAKYRRLQDLPPMKDAPPEYIGGKNPMMWMYPAGWATTQIIVTAGLDRYGYGNASRDIAGRYLRVLIDQYQKTGQLWEKYNVVDGSLILPNARYGNIPYHSFTAAAVVVLGRRYFEGKKLQII